jgi:hypothetical protein
MEASLGWQLKYVGNIRELRAFGKADKSPDDMNSVRVEEKPNAKRKGAFRQCAR